MATWLTAPFESTSSGNLVMGTIRTGIDKFTDNPRFKFRVEVSWPYTAAQKGMPSESDSELMEEVTEALESVFKADPVAVLAGIYTGDGERTLLFYTLSLHIFQRKFNEALAQFPTLPLRFEAFEDPEWEEYRQMLAFAQADDVAPE